MPYIEYESLDNWHNLAVLINKYFTHYNGYIFRGQADADWKLESTLSRALQKHYPDTKDYGKLIVKHLEEFKENIRGRCEVELNTASNEELWALGQHFGLYTPLLDWTRSPYVALFFSLQGECPSGTRALWAIFEEDINEYNAKLTDESRRIKTVRPLSHHNKRLVSQNGLFLEVPVGEQVEKWIESLPINNPWVTMYKITYPDKIREEALSALNNMNINYASLFPDLIGSSLYTNFRFEIEPYIEFAQVNELDRD